MTTWSLAQLLSGLHDEIQGGLAAARKNLGHPVAKGDASERVWLELLNNYLPERYRAEKAHVVDSEGSFSEQIDVVVFDRHYSPFIFKLRGQIIIPAESVYGVFEAKQSVDADEVRYARRKIASVRKLHRTSLRIPHAGGTYAPKPPIHILGGLLTFESEWKPPMGEPLHAVLSEANAQERLDLGCIAAHGVFEQEDGEHAFIGSKKAATAFLFNLISRLQVSGTVPMIDIQAYARWLTA